MSEKLPIPEIDKTGTIRKFVDGGLAAAVDRAVAAIPPGKTVAVVGFADLNGCGAAITTKIGESWSVMAVVDYKWGGVLEAQAAIRWTN